MNTAQKFYKKFVNLVNLMSAKVSDARKQIVLQF